MSNNTYSIIGPVTKKVTRPVNQSPKQPKRGGQPGISGLETQSISFATTDTTKTVTFSTLNDAAQCIPFMTGKTEVAAAFALNPCDGFAVDIFDDAGTVKATVTRENASSAISYTLALTLFELKSSVTVTKYTYTSETIPTPAFYLDKTITAVNTSASFVIVTHHSPLSQSALFGMSRNLCGQLTSSTNLRLWGLYCATAIGKIIAYVVSDPTGATFTTTSTFTSLDGSTPVNSVNLAVPTVNNKVLTVTNFHAHGGSASYPNVAFMGKHQWTGYYTTTSEWYSARSNGVATGRIARLNVQQITFARGVRVQRAGVGFITTDLTKDTTITAVDTASSAALGFFGTNIDNLQISADTAGCPLEECTGLFSLTSSTNMRMTRRTASTANGSFGVQILTLT